MSYDGGPHWKSAPLMYWAAASICAHIWDTCSAHAGQSERKTTHPASLGTSLSILLISLYPRSGDYVPAHVSAIRTAICLPIEWNTVVVQSLAQGGFTSLGQSCFIIPFPQTLCSRDGRKTSSAPIAMLCAGNARLVLPQYH